jgi:hypothetical protein
LVSLRAKLQQTTRGDDDMMYASIRGADGQVLGNVAIDPTAPGGLQGQLSSAVDSLQRPQGLPQNARPVPPSFLPPGPPQPTSQSRPFVCQMRYLTRTPNGAVQWAVRSINCPVGLPPGIYIHAPGQ